MRGIPRPGASETFEPNMPDVEHVPSDDETFDIPAWGDLFPDDDEAGPSVVPKRPRKNAPSPSDPPDPNEPPPLGGEAVEEPRIPLNSVALRVHQAHGHAPFDRNCASCVSSRGKVPARRLRRKLQKEDQTIGLDFMYFGKLRVLLVVHLSSHYVLALPAVDLHDKTLERNFDRFVREVGLTGKTVTIRCDNEGSLLAAAERLTARSTVSRAVIDPVAGYRLQSKGGVERMVAVVKQSFWSVWLDMGLEVTRSQSADAETRCFLEACFGKRPCFIRVDVITCGTRASMMSRLRLTGFVNRLCRERVLLLSEVWCLRRLQRVKRTWLSFEGRIWLSAHICDLCIHAEVECLHVLKAVVRSKFFRRVVLWQMPIQLMIVGL